MTNEKAIKMLQTEKACVERQERKQNCNRYCESCDLCMPIEDVIEGYNYAIRALKNEQTDGDLISRQAVLKCFNVRELKFKDKEDAELMKHYLELAFDDLAKLPSAEETAEWYDKKMTIKKAHGIAYGRWGCSSCKAKFPQKSKYCPNCGCRMKGVE